MSGNNLEGLPKQFTNAMRTLFDIMDDKRTGFVKFADIEHRWRDDGTKGLPKGVIESLRKVTPPNGLLSFDRFCTGLKICLLKNQKVDGAREDKQYQQQPIRPPSAPLLDTENNKKVHSPWGTTINADNNNINNANNNNNNYNNNRHHIYAHRTVSMPQLISKDIGGDQLETVPAKPLLLGPPKPPRLNLAGGGGGSGVVTTTSTAPIERGVDKLEIRTALQNWQMGLLQADKRFNYVMAKQGGRSLGDGKSANQNDLPMAHKKPGARRREPRRHTLQNGIDYNMLRRMKQLEQEKEILLQGLQAVDKARDWYHQQLTSLNEKMRFLGRDACYHSEQWSEAQTERIGMQRARVLEVNRQLAALTDPSVPLHMNLALGGATDSFLTRLKQQNHLLTEEVRKKSDQVSTLEREKASLIRELFQARAHHEINH